LFLDGGGNYGGYNVDSSRLGGSFGKGHRGGRFTNF